MHIVQLDPRTITLAGDPIRRVLIGSLDGNKQPLLGLPAAYVKNHPKATHAEIRDTQVGVAIITLVTEQQVPVYAKRYKIVTHHQSSWVSIPRSWLKRINAKPGDIVEAFLLDDQEHLILRLKRK